eukprot:TRINITY_DN18591_c0_g1_i2.p1 TRINITY_DN18591_c0_g1~~TRINITY_DN18591_c0_g1_i2.p1  ORF type:complete len:463 (+),score=72.24 TRINITY_DN18591_c0_g1_i2:105-1493(+)
MRATGAAVLLTLAAVLCSCQGEVLQVIFIHRHGARTRLDKDGSTLTESASELTPEGMDQLYSAGLQARQRYLERPACEATSTCLKGNWSTYTNSLWSSQSSALDRTLQSAQAFLLGLLPPANATNTLPSLLGYAGGIQPVPIYSLPLSNDWIIRAFGEQKCPVYLNRLQQFYTNNSYYADESAKYSSLLSTLSTAFNTQVLLKDIWNYFDGYTVQANFGANTPAGGPALPDIGNETLAELKNATDWMEWNRYGNRSQAGSLCAGGLLAQIVAQVEIGAAALAAIPASIDPGPRLNHYSAHYGTMLSLLAAVNLTFEGSPYSANQELQKVPNYASVIALELAVDSNNELTIAAYFQNGPTASYQQIYLPCGTTGTCLWTDFKNHVNGSTYAKVGAWCEACANTTMTSCAASKYLQLLAANGTATLDSPTSGASSFIGAALRSTRTALAVAAFVSAILFSAIFV